MQLLLVLMQKADQHLRVVNTTYFSSGTIIQKVNRG